MAPPIHEYQCQKCGKIKEEVYLMSETPPPKISCKCGEGSEAVKIISASNFSLSGRDWPSKDIKNRRR